MSATGYTPISLYYSTTASTSPTAGNLINGELAINITDGKLFYKDNAGVVQVIGWKVVPVTAGGTGKTSWTANGVLYASGTTTLDNSTSFVWDSTNKRLGLNAGTPNSTLVVNANSSTSPPSPLTGTNAEVHGADGAANRLALNAYANNAVLTFVRANNTMASPSAVASGDALGGMVMTGYNSSAYSAARASILSYAEENWSTTANGTSWRFYTTPTGSTTNTERGRITPNGGWSFGSTGIAYGTSGQVLTSAGDAPPTWTTVSGLPTMVVVTGTSQSATAGNNYVLTNAAATTVTLPASPTAGDVIYVTVGNGLTTNVVARNGNPIQSIAEDLTLNAPYAAVQLRYVNATIGWTFL